MKRMLITIEHSGHGYSNYILFSPKLGQESQKRFFFNDPVPMGSALFKDGELLRMHAESTQAYDTLSAIIRAGRAAPNKPWLRVEAMDTVAIKKAKVIFPQGLRDRVYVTAATNGWNLYTAIAHQYTAQIPARDEDHLFRLVKENAGVPAEEIVILSSKKITIA